MRFLMRAVVLLLMTACLAAAQSLGDLARQQRKEQAKCEGGASSHVYTNADLPKSGGISIFGPPASKESPAEAPADAASLLSKQADQEKLWRSRFADARQKLQMDRARLDVAQRERNLDQMQYYSNPNVALREQYSQADLKKKTQEVDLLKKQIEADKKTLNDLSDELRRQGLPPGWARP